VARHDRNDYLKTGSTVLLKPTKARSRIMRAIKSRDTRPELALRSLAHRLGYRFRVHRNDLPGKPDVVFPAKRKVIFMHGCFWHSHDCGQGPRVPARNRDYWKAKLARNRARDRVVMKSLVKLGWKAIVFWECELQDLVHVASKLRRFLR